jgi:hypothetical protein
MRSTPHRRSMETPPQMTGRPPVRPCRWCCGASTLRSVVTRGRAPQPHGVPSVGLRPHRHTSTPPFYLPCCPARAPSSAGEMQGIGGWGKEPRCAFPRCCGSQSISCSSAISFKSFIWGQIESSYS